MLTCDTGGDLNKVTHFYHYKVQQQQCSGSLGLVDVLEQACYSRVDLNPGHICQQARQNQLCTSCTLPLVLLLHLFARRP